ncbi:MAG: RNA polymerase sigma factor [Pseudomonadota bacterium]
MFMGKIVSLTKRKSSSFEELCAPHLEVLYRLAYRFTNDRHNAEDLVQDLLTKLFARAQELTAIEPLRPWLIRSLYNLFIDRVRAQGRSPFISLDENAPEVATWAADGPTPEDSADQALTTNLIQAALDKLSEEHRAVVTLHDVEGYTLQELAVTLDVPIGTLKSRLHRARAALRGILSDLREPNLGTQRYKVHTEVETP